MKKYISPNIYCIDIDAAEVMAGGASQQLRVSLNNCIDGTNDTPSEDDFAAPEYRSTLWGE
ncbi:MAG: hypothetical protein K6E86_05115 [Bacteroidales bacterium]|nr:hypothetical protein [Bacteroidales bacterium]